eukprot:m.179991 g.179991  ORF g.179991 m.179991 type:complete len:361 (-) comp53437_c0_seq1:908-1990(-)
MHTACAVDRLTEMRRRSADPVLHFHFFDRVLDGLDRDVAVPHLCVVFEGGVAVCVLGLSLNFFSFSQPKKEKEQEEEEKTRQGWETDFQTGRLGIRVRIQQGGQRSEKVEHVRIVEGHPQCRRRVERQTVFVSFKINVISLRGEMRICLAPGRMRRRRNARSVVGPGRRKVEVFMVVLERNRALSIRLNVIAVFASLALIVVEVLVQVVVGMVLMVVMGSRHEGQRTCRPLCDLTQLFRALISESLHDAIVCIALIVVEGFVALQRRVALCVLMLVRVVMQCLQAQLAEVLAMQEWRVHVSMSFCEGLCGSKRRILVDETLEREQDQTTNPCEWLASSSAPLVAASQKALVDHSAGSCSP